MKIDVSIIIPSFNTKDLTLACIDSIIKSIKDLNYEIIVIDNASEDSSDIEILSLKSNIQNLNVIINKNNLGFSKAVNKGIKQSKGEYILILNSDTKVKGESISKLLEFARKTQDAGVIGPRLVNKDGSDQPSCFRFPTIVGAIKEYWLGIKGSFEKYIPVMNSHSPFVGVDAVVGAAFLISPLALQKVGLFDERYFMYYEDIDYCRRVKQALLKVYYFPASELIHYHGESGKNLETLNYQWRRLIPSSKIYYGIIKYYLITLIIWSSQKVLKIFGKD